MPLRPRRLLAGRQRRRREMNPHPIAGDGQGLGIAATFVHRPRKIEHRPGRDLAVATGKDVREAGRYRISSPVVQCHGTDPDSPDRYVTRGGVKGKIRNRPRIPIPARAVGRTGADVDRPADGQNAR